MKQPAALDGAQLFRRKGCLLPALLAPPVPHVLVSFPKGAIQTHRPQTDSWPWLSVLSMEAPRQL